jgi:hypothetical protein
VTVTPRKGTSVVRVLADYHLGHHADLFESLQLTLGDRLGFEMYAPFGMEWFERRHWNFERSWHGDAVARQYLVGIWGDARPDANGIVSIPDTRHPGRTLRGITLDAALTVRWEIVLSSVPDNARGFRQVADLTGARFGIHIGNQWGDEAWLEHPSFAIVTTTSPIPSLMDHVVVHQEFRREVFRYAAPSGFGPVRSFVNCFPETPEYPNFQQTARQAPELRWEVYGAVGSGQPDEFTQDDLHGIDLVADSMRGAGVIWHAKHWSDGFGHVIHNAFAVGRPVFGYQRYYADKLAGPLWQDGVTSWDVESHGRSDTLDMIRTLRDNPDRYLEMCEAAARRFDEVVDFAADADKVARLLGVGVAA